MEDVRFFYVRDKNRVPIATVAMKKIGTSYVATIAVCSRKDQFSKKRGRHIALSRALLDKFEERWNHDPTILAYHIIEDILGANSHMRKQSTRDSLDTGKIGRSLMYVAHLLDKRCRQ